MWCRGLLSSPSGDGVDHAPHLAFGAGQGAEPVEQARRPQRDLTGAAVDVEAAALGAGAGGSVTFEDGDGAAVELQDASVRPRGHHSRAQGPGRERSMARWMLLDPRARLVWRDWERVAHDYVHGLRLAAAHPADRATKAPSRRRSTRPSLTGNSLEFPHRAGFLSPVRAGLWLSAGSGHTERGVAMASATALGRRRHAS